MMSSESYISSSSSHWKHDVFLSFRGEDTRNNFTSHLYTALNQRGINVFKDDKQLERGKSISPELLRAIEESRFSIIVFSRNYAYSTWCLDELVKIVECKNARAEQQLIFPIFYHVEPTVVRKQEGEFQEAFAKHEVAFKGDIGKVQKWRDALQEMANISGWELTDRSDSEFIEDIAMEISSKLIPTNFETHKQLVGIDWRLKKLRLLLDTGYNDVRMIGVWGMGGLGKTTIARAVYDLISPEFQASSFLANVRENSEKGDLMSLQKQLLADLLNLKNSSIWNVYNGIDMLGSRLQYKKVLVVIDDVVDVKQLEYLAGNHYWFGSGSRIIITSRDKHLLKTHGVDEVYELEKLSFDEALRLFFMKAFKTHQPSKEYEDLSKSVVKYAAGLPLALRVLGSFLCDRTVQVWESALQRLETDLTEDIMQVLQISFDGLKETEKSIFLDIACFFKGKDRDYVTKILDSCGFHSIVGIEVLVEKSLISVEKTRTSSLDHKYIVWMHDLLQEMGKQIVKRECPSEPGKRSRLWKKEDVHHVLTKNTGTEVVEAIICKYEMHLNASVKAFSRMTSLRLLRVSNVQLPEGLDYLSNELRLLEWPGYPLKFLPSNFRMEKILEIDLHGSSIEKLWHGMKHLNMLKVINLSHCQNLIRTPDFTGVLNLEELILEGCAKLENIHQSSLIHEKLSVLNMRDCTSLKKLPKKIAMSSLTKFVLSGCSKLQKFPVIGRSMERLTELFLDGTAITVLPSSIDRLPGLVLLNLKDCKNFKSLPDTINGLKRLKNLDLSGCCKLENVPENLGEVESLEVLDLSGTAVRQPPLSISLLKNLQVLSFRGCKGPTSTTWFSGFPRRSSDHMGLMLPYFSGLCSLRELDLSDCNLGEGAIPSDICNLSSLAVLNLSKNSFVSLPGTINRLRNLEVLYLRNCKMLQSLPELPSSMYTLKLDGCASLESVLDALIFSGVWSIYCINCLKLVSNEDYVFSVLRRFIEAKPNPRNQFGLVIPGSKIPEWFRYQNEGSSINVTSPQNSYNRKKLVGYAICCVFHVQKQTYKPNCLSHTIISLKSGKIYCTLHFEAQRVQPGSDHLWLIYRSTDRLSESNHVEVSLGPDYNLCASHGVKSCGVHPVYVDESDDEVFEVGS